MELTGRTLGIDNKFRSYALNSDHTCDHLCHAYTKSLWGEKSDEHLLYAETFPESGNTYCFKYNWTLLPSPGSPQRHYENTQLHSPKELNLAHSLKTAPTSQYIKRTAQICSHLVILNYGGKQLFPSVSFPSHLYTIMIFYSWFKSIAYSFFVWYLSVFL